MAVVVDGPENTKQILILNYRLFDTLFTMASNVASKGQVLFSSWRRKLCWSIIWIGLILSISNVDYNNVVRHWVFHLHGVIEALLQDIEAIWKTPAEINCGLVGWNVRFIGIVRPIDKCGYSRPNCYHNSNSYTVGAKLDTRNTQQHTRKNGKDRVHVRR